MNRKFEDKHTENSKFYMKQHQKEIQLKLSLDCSTPRTNKTGFISGMTLDQYFSTVRETTDPEVDSECSSLDLIGDTAIREIDEDNYSSSKDIASQDTARQLLTHRQNTNEAHKHPDAYVKLPCISQNTFAKLKKIQIPPLALTNKDRMSVIRTLYGSINFKKSVRKSKKEDPHTLTTTSFGSKIKKPMFSRRDKSEMFMCENGSKQYQQRGSALETVRYSKERVALRE